MDRFFDRLGDVIKNFLDDEDQKLFGGNRSRSAFKDPDLDAAEAELDEFLNRGKRGQTDRKSAGGAWSDPRHDERFGPSDDDFRPRGGRMPGSGSAKSAPAVPEALRKDFDELGVPFGASAEICKSAYKKLLKTHHPDRHAGHEGNMRKATEKSARINAAYQRIESWRETGNIG